ncbi:MAG: ribonuclease H-like domain-containing protein [Patescibacteria group bacterium]
MKAIIDIETQNSFADIGSRINLDMLKISVAVVYWYPDDKYYFFFEEDMEKFENLLSKAEYIIGFNSVSFDLPILQRYMENLNLLNKKQIDLMVKLEEILGYKVSLQAVAKATFGVGKISSGLEAIKMWKDGRIEELKKYCMDDVRLTKEIYEYGLKNKTVKFNAGWDNYDVPIEW